MCAPPARTQVAGMGNASFAGEAGKLTILAESSLRLPGMPGREENGGRDAESALYWLLAMVDFS
jgi:hypothetical protein